MGAQCLNIFFMNTPHGSQHIVIPGLSISLKAETARLLIEMANDMEISLEDVFSSLAEDAVIDLTRNQKGLDSIVIPEKCSKEDLLNAIE